MVPVVSRERAVDVCGMFFEHVYMGFMHVECFVESRLHVAFAYVYFCRRVLRFWILLFQAY